MVLVLCWLLATLPAAGEKKRINVTGSLGMATSGVDEALLDLGVEFQLSGGLYFSFLINSHLGGDERHYYYGYPYNYYYAGSPYSFGIRISTNRLYGLNTYGVYKIPFSRKTGLFAKAGLSYIFYSKYDFDEAGYYQEVSESGFGAGLGAGVEFTLGSKAVLLLGGTYKLLFREKPRASVVVEDMLGTSWLKVYVGLNYRLR
jgi:hypothetical protein